VSAPAAVVGTGELARFGSRRDRIVLPIWLYVVAGLTIITAVSFDKLYPTTASRVSFASGIATNPGIKALTGPTFDLTTIGGLTAWRLGALGGVLISLMNVFTVIRHTRAEEEAGRLELVGAGRVGRAAPLTAALVIAVGADVVIGLVAALGLIATGQPATGSFALGASLAAVGATFAGVAAITAQLTETSRAANGLACTVLGLAYLLRAVGDSSAQDGPTWLSWLSPIGWGQQVRPFASERWWVLGLPVGAAVVTIGIAYALVARRDLGSGLLPSRPGPPTASAALRGPLSLAWRLQRGVLLGWAAGVVVFGVAVGGIAKSIVGIAGSSPQLKQIVAQLGGSGGLVDSFLAAMLGLLGLLSAVYTVQAVLRLRTEETGLRAEPVLATRTGRVPFAAAHLVVALLGSAGLLALGGAVTGLAHGVSSGDLGDDLPKALAGALVQLPAAWVLAGVATALFGLFPRFAVGGWAALVVCLLLGQLGPALGAPQWAMDISPFTHVPKLPGGDFSATPVVWLVVVAALFVVVGLAGFRRRDIG
jgi:ABC-2 type transport system permease protein